MAATQLYRIEIAGQQQEFFCAPDQVLLIGMERQNASGIRVGCRGGGCGVCKVRIIDGLYETKCMSRKHVSEAEEQQGIALACRVMPRSDLLLGVVHQAADSSPGNGHDNKNSNQVLRKTI